MKFSDDLERERDQVIRLVRHASAGWADAMVAHRMAPPDPGFADRLQSLSEAAATEQLAWEQAGSAGLAWQPIQQADGAEPPYELRPGTGRRGPAELWATFDAAVTTLNAAIGGARAEVVAAAFGELSQTAADLAEAVRREDELALAAQERARPRNVV